MKIIINEEIYQLSENATIDQALEIAKIDNRYGIAVAVNNCVVSKDQWKTKVLKENDNLFIISAICGG